MTPNIYRLAEKISNHFSPTELKILCANLGVDFEDIAGETLNGKCVELVLYFDRLSSLIDLLVECRKMRPRVDFENLRSEQARHDAASEILPPAPISGSSPLAEHYHLQAAFIALYQILQVDYSAGWAKYPIDGRAKLLKDALNRAAATTLTVYDRAKIDNAIEYLRSRMSQEHRDGSEPKPTHE